MAGASPVENEAFVTLATNDTYSLGALVLAHSLRRVGTTRRLAIMVTPGVSSSLRSQLASVFDFVVPVDVLDSQDQVNLSLLTRPDLGVTFTKLHCWRLTQFAKCVFLDADTLVVQNIDELFDREELSAAPDAGWPDCFNSGVFVYTPSTETYQALLNFAVQYGSFDGGDQGLLNLYFSDWSTKDIKRHLPFTYNVVSQAFYSYLPAFRQFGKSVKIVHFIGALKPWHASYNTATRQASGDSGTFHHQEYLQLWWDIFMAEVNVKLDPEVARILSFVTSSPYHAFQRISANQDQAMIAPYKPPDLNIFYEPFREEEKADCEKEEIHTYIAPPNPDRTFEHFENFYAEPPMSRSENYPQSAEVYMSCDQQVTLEDFTKASSPETEEIVTDNNCTSEDNNNATDSSNNHEHSPLDNNVTNQTPADNPDDNHNPGDQSEESVGLVGELASLRIVDPAGPQGAYSQEQLQNRQRQYEWERGQVDYLGMDSFSQIQQHLDNVVSGRTAIDLKVGVATTGAAASDTEKPAASDAEKPAEKQ